MAAVGEEHDPHALGELAEHAVELVVDQLAVVEAPGLVQPIGLVVAVAVRHLPAMPGIGQEQDVAGGELGRGVLHRLGELGDGRVLGQQHGDAAVAALLGELGHVVGVGLAGAQLTVPAVIVLRVDEIEAEMDRDALGHVRSSWWSDQLVEPVPSLTTGGGGGGGAAVSEPK